MTSKTEIESLLFLLDDPDPAVQSSVLNRLDELGENAVPLLDQFRSESRDASEKEAIHDIIHKITFSTLYEDFSDLLEEGLDSRRQLEKAVLLLSRFGNPTLRTSEYRQKLDRFGTIAEEEIMERSSDRQKMHTLLKFVFRDLRFRGDDKNYHNPENAFLDRVIDRRMGLPISLSLIVMFLGRRLDLPFYGVNMPIHFMLIYEGESGEVLVDPFDGGTVVTYDQCHYFLKKNGINPRPEHLKRASGTDILARAVRNLIHSYAKNEKDEKVRDLQTLLRLIELKG